MCALTTDLRINVWPGTFENGFIGFLSWVTEMFTKAQPLPNRVVMPEKKKKTWYNVGEGI